MARKDASQSSDVSSIVEFGEAGCDAGFEREAAEDAAGESVDGFDAQAAGRFERFREQFAGAADIVGRNRQAAGFRARRVSGGAGRSPMTHQPPRRSNRRDCISLAAALV
jgi:hypothetical protein